MPLPPRPFVTVQNKTGFLFTPVELEAVEKQFSNTIILKFFVGRPPIHVIQEHITKNWHLTGLIIVGLLDPQHVMVHLASNEDLVRALSKESHMINHCMYRSFRWSSDFSFKKDNPKVAV